MNVSPVSAAPVSPTPRSYRRRGTAMNILGAIITAVGGVAVIVGGILPWARFALFGVPIVVPGILTWGAATLAAGVLALTYARRLPLVCLLLGLGVLVGGFVAEQAAGKAVVGVLLRISNALAPVNARLAQATLPPIDPAPSIGPAGRYLGEGPLWTIWGGVGLAAGGTLRLLGTGLRRTCAFCGRSWEAERADSVIFCPFCGRQAADSPNCVVCYAGLRKKDRFCWRCGTPTQPPRSPG